MPSWDPTQYDKFAAERGRPFVDLVSRVSADEPRLVADLGCGNGALTLSLLDRWPGARVVGVDGSAEMLAAARERDPQGRVEWVEADLGEWDIATLGGSPDVVVTNATLQWVPGHLPIVEGWARALAPGGWIAIQVPGNHEAPSHSLMRELAEAHPRAAELEAATKRFGAGEPSTYLRILDAAGLSVDAWETTYLHQLDRAGEQENPVLEWLSGTGLRPILDVLTDDAEREDFIARYGEVVARAYPRTPAGVLLPFRRVFAVAQKPA